MSEQFIPSEEMLRAAAEVAKNMETNQKAYEEAIKNVTLRQAELERAKEEEKITQAKIQARKKEEEIEQTLIERFKNNLVKPENLSEVVKALELKSEIEKYLEGRNANRRDEIYELSQAQNKNIQDFIQLLGDFDSQILSRNIEFLTNRYKIRIGQVEELIGVSTGYLSRTIREGSKKNISIDAVWKIAKLFDTDIRTLIETDMRREETNISLLGKFLDKLYENTVNNSLTWKSGGGHRHSINSVYKQMGLIAEENGSYIYHPAYLDGNTKRILASDIVYAEYFHGSENLTIIPFKDSHGIKDHVTNYDFIFVRNHEGTWLWDKIFYTFDDHTGFLRKKAEKLYKKINERLLFDTEISPEIREIITGYIGR